MTNKEAIDWLKAIKEKYIHGGDERFDELRKEALDIAIKVLEEVQEWHKLKCICSNEGIYVYKEKNNDK